jgi:hypothetical protein
VAEAVETSGRAAVGAAPGVTRAGGDDAPGACPECATALVGEYCHGCGEKRPEARDLSLRHFFSEAAQELTSVEHSKLYHTLRALLLRPGFLTNEWAAGRRRRYLKPLNLCLGILALYLFAYSVYKPVSIYDLEVLLRQSGNPAALKPYEHLAAKKHMELSAFLDRATEKWQRYMSFAPLPLVGAFALVLQLVFLFTRRYFVEHLVFSMHFVSFTTLTALLLWPVYFFIGIKMGGVNYVFMVSKWLVDIAYVFFAVRAFYGLRPGRTLLASLLLVAGYFVCFAVAMGAALAAAVLTVVFS